MATSKTLAPTNVTISIPAMADAPDASVFSNCVDKEADAINALNSHIAVLPSYTQCANRTALETHLSSVASGMTDNQIQTVYIITGASFGFEVFGSGERYAGELKRMTSTQFVCKLASRLGDSIDIGYYDGTYTYNYLLRKDWAINTSRRYSLLGFNSSSNQYQATADGYVQVQVWNADSNIEIWFEENQISIPVTYSGMRAYMFFLRKGLHIWIGGSGSNRSAYIQLIE